MSRTRATDACEPAPAERIRSILAAAGSVGVTSDGAREDVMAGVAAEFDGMLRLRVPADSLTAAKAAYSPPSGLQAVLEWTDLAPVPVRGRVRAQVRVAARLHHPKPLTAPPAGALPAPGEAVRLRVDVRHAALVTAGTAHLVTPADLAAARPDPIACAEARLLLHLADGHPEHVEALARLLPMRCLLGVTRITPLALDRHGIVFRLETRSGHSDVRLPFTRPLTDPDELGHRIHAQLAHAHRHRRPS